MSRVVWAASEALESSSAQITRRLRVAASMTTIGAPGFSACDMSVSGAGLVLFMAIGLSRPGTRTTMSLPGLNPSFRLYGAALIWLLAPFVGIAAWGRRTRTPVGVELSLTV